jgi:protein OS-9
LGLARSSASRKRCPEFLQRARRCPRFPSGTRLPTPPSIQAQPLIASQFSVDFPEGHVSSLQAQEKLDQEYHPDDPAHSHLDTSPLQSDNPQYDYEELVLAHQHYLCQIPRIVDQKPSSQPNETLSKQDHEKELARANTRGWQLLKGMQGNCIYYWSGWWSYRYCYGQGVKQFHQLPPSQAVPAYPPVEDPAVPGFMLGAVQDQTPHHGQETPSEEKAVGKLETRGESRYLVQRLAGGTLCDLTGKERRIEVQFHCNPATADRIKEVATCAYLMIIQTPRLCNDVAFQPPRKDRANKIACSPILDQDEVSEYEAAVAAASDILATDIPNPLADSQSKAPVTIGGITIGAHKWVPEGSKIEKSAIVGGGKEKFVETIADSFGKAMSADELKRLGLGDAKSVETLKKELEKIAGGQGWELKVFDTPDGREYRGVLLGDEEPDSAKKEGAEVTNTKKVEPKPGNDAPSDDDQKKPEGTEETYKDEL